MAMAVLRSQSYLRGRLYDESVALNPPAGSNRRPIVSNVSPNRVSRRRRRSPVGSPPSGQDRDRNGFRGRGLVAKVPANNLVMGQVKILKRGEKLNNQSLGVVPCENRKPRAKCEQELDLVLGSTSRLGPDPEMVNKQIRVSDGLYAGSGACFQSPAPSSVPLPAFLGKNGAATSDLRRLLKLDFA